MMDEERREEIRRLHERSMKRHGKVYEALAKWERENELIAPSLATQKQRQSSVEQTNED